MTRSKTGETSIFYQYVKPVFLEIFSQFFDEKESEKRAEQAIKTIRKELGGMVFYIPRTINQSERRRLILDEYNKGGISIKELAQKHNVTYQWVHQITKSN